MKFVLRITFYIIFFHECLLKDFELYTFYYTMFVNFSECWSRILWLQSKTNIGRGSKVHFFKTNLGCFRSTLFHTKYRRDQISVHYFFFSHLRYFLKMRQRPNTNWMQYTAFKQFVLLRYRFIWSKNGIHILNLKNLPQRCNYATVVLANKQNLFFSLCLFRLFAELISFTFYLKLCLYVNVFVN